MCKIRNLPETYEIGTGLENMISETEYLTYSTEDGEKAEKITMMSMLFCSHGD